MAFSAVIVLGNLMSQSGILNNESSSRMDIAINAFFENQIPYIITCGWAYRNDSSIAIADAMKRYAIKTKGVPSNSILTVKTSRDTVGDAIFTKAYVATNRGWNDLLVVTSDYHVRRSEKIFNYIYGSTYNIKFISSDTGKADSQFNSEKNSLDAFHKTFINIASGDDKGIHDRLCKSHPYYNGFTYPKIERKNYKEGAKS